MPVITSILSRRGRTHPGPVSLYSAFLIYQFSPLHYPLPPISASLSLIYLYLSVCITGPQPLSGSILLVPPPSASSFSSPGRHAPLQALIDIVAANFYAAGPVPVAPYQLWPDRYHRPLRQPYSRSGLSHGEVVLPRVLTTQLQGRSQLTIALVIRIMALPRLLALKTSTHVTAQPRVILTKPLASPTQLQYMMDHSRPQFSGGSPPY